MNKSLTLKDGTNIGYQEWGVGHAQHVLCLHGWLDNSNSFEYLGPCIARSGFHVIAVDLVGHGLSSHVSKDSMNHFFQYITHVKYILESLSWDKACIIGHSMGGIVSTIFSGTFPEMVSKLVLIEGFTPIIGDASKLASHLRKAIEAEDMARSKDNGDSFGRPNRKYPTLGAAVDARIRVVSTYPGQQFISSDAAFSIVTRGTALSDGQSLIGVTDLTVGPVHFVYDSRHMLPGYFRLSMDQAESFVNGITSPVLYITGENGWPPSSSETANRFQSILLSKGLLSHQTLPGSHHLHLDPDSKGTVANAVCAFLTDPSIPV